MVCTKPFSTVLPELLTTVRTEPLTMVSRTVPALMPASKIKASAGAGRAGGGAGMADEQRLYAHVGTASPQTHAKAPST